jgi:hypothetical protein
MYKRVALVMVALALLVFVGCAKPPEAEIQKATSSLDAAKMAEAETYAPASYQVAADTMNAASAAKTEADGKFALFRSYTKAKALYISADGLAQKAAADAAAGKEQVKAEVTAKLTEVQALIDTVTMALKKAPRGKGSEPDIKLMENSLATVNAAFTDAQNDFNAGKYMVAKNKLGTVVNQANDVKNQIEAAKAAKAAAKSTKSVKSTKK